MSSVNLNESLVNLASIQQAPHDELKSLYKLPERNSSDYRFRNTVTFWIAVSFVEGSLLFAAGALASLVELEDDWLQFGLVELAYLAGSCFFTLGAYLGYFEVINLGRARTRLIACAGTSRAAFYGSLFYFVGALLFNVACLRFLFPPSAAITWVMYWGASAIGSACFTAAACIEFRHNEHVSCATPVFWLCFWYLVGSLLFLLAAVAGWPRQKYEDWLVNLPYLAGSVAFALGAWCALWMWKAEQFGLGFIREINEVHENSAPAGHGSGPQVSPYNEYHERSQRSSSVDEGGSHAHAHAHAHAGGANHSVRAAGASGGASGHGAAPGWNPGKVFLLVYVLIGTLSVLDVCLGVAFASAARERHAHGHATPLDDPTQAAGRILSSVGDFLAVHTILMLATIVHRTPTLHPYDYLLWLMRCATLVYLAIEVLRFVGSCRLFSRAHEA